MKEPAAKQTRKRERKRDRQEERKGDRLLAGCAKAIVAEREREG